jgi:RNA polymerase sigma-70 factor (ECF subfamily)
MAPEQRTTSLTLLERVRAREEEAWRRLHHLYAPLIEGWCAHWGVRGQDADDVRQEVFQAVAQGLDRFHRDRTRDTFQGWLRVITRSKLLDHFRRRKSQPEAQGGTDARQRMEQLADRDLPADSVEDIGGLYRRALELVRGEFEERTWQAFWRTAIDNHPADLVAADLGVTAAAVRKAKSRVLHRLREEVGDLLPPQPADPGR